MILVTGATGLVGTHLLILLAQEKHQIRALYRTEAKREHAKNVFLQCCAPEERDHFESIHWAQGDLNNIPSLTEAFEGVTHVYHCAAMISFNPSHYRKLRKINIKGTANIVNLCLIHDVQKLCYVSSIATLSEHTSQKPIDETAEWNPEVSDSVYAITKYGAEMEVWRGTQEGLNAVIVNPGIIIGPGFFNSGSGYLFKKIHNGMKYYTTGTTGYVAIKDVIKIMYHLMGSNINNERYILVGENLSFKSAFTLIATSLGKSAPKKKISPFLMKIAYYIQLFSHSIFRTKRSIFKSSIKSAFSNSFYENEKIKKELTYSFKPIEKAIQETASFYLK
ncbi:NAD-dependent epimerase/dehydratase family protein [Aquimarina sp. 2201CG14-23]|uniref:NAD-dependent epimerase/dehydratase family protein n=1 Tax=Aquimarina mycalae TaxID=3040073 RepID=UPI002477F300|nr:NAD-dependent epimerase/dehydratase family protein [Aquimarina sp. 2201CG14-23]MDH7446018.1 NAD-dependent epimerase/dehydratase family protein [Aquimarina sp. 2201CG14-23]